MLTSRITTALAACAATLTTALGAALVAPAAPAHADGPGAGSPWVVTLGDSYISGEAGRWAGSAGLERRQGE